MDLSDRIESDFTYHAPSEDQILTFQVIRGYARTYAHLINELVPEGREKSMALTKLEEAVMWSNAGLARSGEQ